MPIPSWVDVQFLSDTTLTGEVATVATPAVGVCLFRSVDWLSVDESVFADKLPGTGNNDELCEFLSEDVYPAISGGSCTADIVTDTPTSDTADAGLHCNGFAGSIIMKGVLAFWVSEQQTESSAVS